MRRFQLLGALGGVLGVAAVVAVVAAGAVAAGEPVRAGADAHRPAHLSTHLQVTQVEYRLLLSRAVVKAGPVTLQEIDGGMDSHNLNLRYGNSPTVIAEPLLGPGMIYDTVVDLRPGIYHLWCSVPGHWMLGMHAVLRVER